MGSRPPAPSPTPAPPPISVPAPSPQPAPEPVTPPQAGPIPKPTPGSDFLSCNNFSGAGSFATFGGAPGGCDTNPAQSSAFANAQYAPVIFRDGANSAQRDYMSELFPVARELGKYYIKRRNPNVSQAETDGFLAGFFALLHQETIWTHYRRGQDQILRYMRGDSLHGFGIMQVDDRSHAVALNQGKGVDLVDNMIYGLDVYYAQWVRSANSSCVDSATNYEQRARAAWSAYNGGPRSICRWTDQSSPHASKDRNYISRYRSQTWLGLVTNRDAASKLNTICMAEGVRPCALVR